MTDRDTQTQGVPDLYHLTDKNNMAGELNIFLLSCKVEGLSPATLKNYRYLIGSFVQFCQQNDVLTSKDVSPQHIRLFMLQLQETNNATSVMDYFKSIKRFFNWLIQERYLDESPVRNIKPPRQDDKVVRPFSKQDIDRLLDWCNPHTYIGVRNRALILVFLDTGLRVSEMAKIQLVDVDISEGIIKIIGKGRKERWVRIGQIARRVLFKYISMCRDDLDCLWVTEEGKPLTKDGIQTIIKVLCKRTGLTGVKKGPHTFRHTAAINCLRNGMGEFALQVMLGHSTLRMTRKYVSSLNQEDVIKMHKIASPVDNMKLK